MGIHRTISWIHSRQSDEPRLFHPGLQQQEDAAETHQHDSRIRTNLPMNEQATRTGELTSHLDEEVRYESKVIESPGVGPEADPRESESRRTPQRSK
jgi:hypothetical protein